RGTPAMVLPPPRQRQRGVKRRLLGKRRSLLRSFPAIRQRLPLRRNKLTWPKRPRCRVERRIGRRLATAGTSRAFMTLGATIVTNKARTARSELGRITRWAHAWGASSRRLLAHTRWRCPC
ncbi:hypothetical protein DXG01_014835, partial [Tephrocybe rancida]